MFSGTGTSDGPFWYMCIILKKIGIHSNIKCFLCIFMPGLREEKRKKLLSMVVYMVYTNVCKILLCEILKNITHLILKSYNGFLQT